MTVAIMQPYFLPYLGYWQLMNAVDIFVIYDNIQYTKKGYINRNSLLCQGKSHSFTLPLKKDSDFLDVRDRYLSETYDRKKLLQQISCHYPKAPYFREVQPLIEEIVRYQEENLFQYIHHSVKNVMNYLDIETKLVISSQISMDHSLKSQDKVLALCNALKADTYINAIGGQALYQYEDFAEEGIDLKFIKMDENIRYPQLGEDFVPNLSILDVLMFNSKDQVQTMLNQYSLISSVTDDKKGH